MKFQAVSLMLAGSATVALANPEPTPAPTAPAVAAPLAVRSIDIGQDIDSFLNKATSAVGDQANRVPSFYSSLKSEGDSAVSAASANVASLKNVAATAVGTAKENAQASITSAEQRLASATGAVGRIAAAASSAAATEFPDKDKEDKDNAAGSQAASRSGLLAVGAAAFALVSGALLGAPLW